MVESRKDQNTFGLSGTVSDMSDQLQSDQDKIR